MANHRRFAVAVPNCDLTDLARRLATTRWIDDVFGGDEAFGAPLPFVRHLVEHWRERFSWRALEARINRQPQLMARVDGLDLHLVHRRSSRADAVPLLLLHGWPSSFLEFLDLCDPLAEPPPDRPAFHVVVPSLPGYAFSAGRTGLGPRQAARLLLALLEELGYRRCFVQGGNWGSTIAVEMARAAPDRLLGLHLNSISGSPPADQAAVAITEQERSLLARSQPPGAYPHFVLYSQVPANIAHALNDSPAGLAAWLGYHLREWADRDWPANPGLAPEWMVGTIALYWLTHSAATASLFYNAIGREPPAEQFVATPTAVFLPAKEIVQIPRGWAERLFNVVRWTRTDRGGHFPAIEIPGLLIDDIRAFVADQTE